MRSIILLLVCISMITSKFIFTDQEVSNLRKTKFLQSIDVNEYNQRAVRKHNELRKLHGVAPLESDEKLRAKAEKYAYKMLNSGNFAHSSRSERNEGFSSPVGENLYWAMGFPATPEDVIQSYYDEIVDYNHDTGRSINGKAIGHYTQVVWKNTQRVGCAEARKGREVYSVCNYFPAGNYVGQYQKNVPRPL